MFHRLRSTVQLTFLEFRKYFNRYLYIMNSLPGISLPADVLWGSFVTHSFLPKRPPKDVCGEATQGCKTRFRGQFHEPAQIAKMLD